MKKFLICLFSFLFIGCSIAGGAVLLSNSSYSDNSRNGNLSQDENEIEENIEWRPEVTQGDKPTNDDLWTDSGNFSTSTNFGGGDGSASNPYIISLPEHLAYLAYRATSSFKYTNKYFKQIDDIDLSEHWWDPISYFAGHYDGGGFRISGLYTQEGSASSNSYQALFGQVAGESIDSLVNIHDIHIYDSIIQGYDYIGGIIGYARNVNLYDCSFNGEIQSTGNRVGGIIGQMQNYNNIDNCINGGNVSGNFYVGGIVGSTSNTITNCKYTINNCSNIGSIISNGTDYSLVTGCGGILGYSGTETYISNCLNQGSVSGEDTYIGGISGTTDYISNCINRGTIFVSENTYIGGIAGDANEIYECSNYGNVSSSNSYSVGGIAGTGKIIEKCYNSGSIRSSRGAGGISGRQYGGSIINCFNKGNVTGSNTLASVAGIAHSLENNGIIANCYNIGRISSSGRACGLVYQLTLGSIINCYNSGYVSGTRTEAALVADNRVSGDYISYCYWGDECTLTVGIQSGEQSLTSEQMENGNANDISWYLNTLNWSSSYSWDFSAVWAIFSNENDMYPVFQDGDTIKIIYHSNYGTDQIYYDFMKKNNNILIKNQLFERNTYLFNGWNTNSDGSGDVYGPGDEYSGDTDLTLYAQWRLPIIKIILDWSGVFGGTPSELYLWDSNGYYLEDNCVTNINKITIPTNNGYTFHGFYSGTNGVGDKLVDENGNFLTTSTTITAWHAYFVANNKAYYDGDGYWYVEIGKMPQSKVDSALKSTLSSNWSSLVAGDSYYLGGTILSSKVYNSEEYCLYNNEYYLVEPIRWRLTYSSNQTTGYGTTEDTLAIMDTIVYVGQYSDVEINAGAGYSSFAVTELKNNILETTFLANETKSMPTFGSTSLNGTAESVTSNIFVASSEEIEEVADSGKIEFSDLVKDYLMASGKDTLYYTRDLGTNYNNLLCMNGNGDKVQYKAQNYLGMQFSIVVTEYACV